MPDITKAYNYCITECNNPNVGYSQAYRNKQTVNGITYYDCSSLMWYALLEGGFDVVSAYEDVCWGYEGNAIVTDYECAWLLALGFTEIPIANEWKAGDILWRDGHTEMVYSGRVTMGAHSSTYALADQVSINSSPSSVSSWSRCFRYSGGAGEETTYEWISSNSYLGQTAMENNAACIYYYLTNKGWSNNAIAGLLGNMQQESTINPGIWQGLNYGNTSGGYGLVQWTPSTKYTNWANANGYDITDGDYQLKWIDERTVPSYEWIPTDSYDISFAEFKVSTQTPEWLASAYMANFERPGDPEEALRRQYARSWYNYILGLPEGGGGGGSPDEPDYPYDPTPITWYPKKKGYNFVLSSKRRRESWTKKTF